MASFWIRENVFEFEPAKEVSGRYRAFFLPVPALREALITLRLPVDPDSSLTGIVFMPCGLLFGMKGYGPTEEKKTVCRLAQFASFLLVQVWVHICAGCCTFASPRTNRGMAICFFVVRSCPQGIEVERVVWLAIL